MHITSFIDPIDIPPLDFTRIDFDEKVNLFIGPNASGKSTILREIKRFHTFALEGPVPLLEENADRPIFAGSEGVTYLINQFGLSASDDWPREESGSVKWSDVPFVYIPATRVNLPADRIWGQHNRASESREDAAPLQLLFDTESGIFDGRIAELAIDWLRGGMVGNHLRQHQLRMVLHRSYYCAKAICSEVMSGLSPRPYVDEYEKSATPESLVHFGMGIETNDYPGGELLYAGELSSGTQSTLLWIYALALKMVDHYRWEEDWEEQPAILLMDEIENHLHPTWQRRVIPALLEHFPGLQIFATTHSPFVVAGLKAGQVHLLKRDENGRVTATTNTEDIIGWTADEILRTMMGVDEPTDQITVDRAKRLRQLREKEALTAEEESELAELRRQVNEDLLSKSGQLGAQQERYADLMERFLLSRQSGQAQDGE